MSSQSFKPIYPESYLKDFVLKDHECIDRITVSQ